MDVYIDAEVESKIAQLKNFIANILLSELAVKRQPKQMFSKLDDGVW